MKWASCCEGDWTSSVPPLVEISPRGFWPQREIDIKPRMKIAEAVSVPGSKQFDAIREIMALAWKCTRPGMSERREARETKRVRRRERESRQIEVRDRSQPGKRDEHERSHPPSSLLKHWKTVGGGTGSRPSPLQASGLGSGRGGDQRRMTTSFCWDESTEAALTFRRQHSRL
ncbi:unnamed protein product [Pleuronectes platessa]|uniref:Uncharacterized protein n=1 Tax=Pleuronectes platessa TaxID=8262 RepID=A0A9N7TIG4_PLEPL|nr:unnamed protein product [Pleuronectes platessa]